MHVVVAHNFYESKSPSGENAVVLRDADLLRQGNHVVTPLYGHSDHLKSRRSVLAAARSAFTADWAGARLKDVHASHKVDILHLHNAYPTLGPAIIDRAQEMGIAVVHTVHNYRHGCIAGTYFRSGSVCRDCDSTSLRWPGIAHACYRGSRAQSAFLTTAELTSGRAYRRADILIALTPFMRDQLVAQGFSQGKIALRPTAVGDPGPPAPQGRHLLFVGRLDETKGIGDLLEAYARASPGVPLQIVGDGPMRDRVIDFAQALAEVEYLGKLAGNDLREAYSNAFCVIIPSRWFEGFPLVAAEAMAHARMLVGPRWGGLTDLTSDGRMSIGYNPAETDGLALALKQACGLTPTQRANLGEAARRRYESELTEDEGLRRLLAIYELAIANRANQIR